MTLRRYRIGSLIALKTSSDIVSRLCSFLLLLLAARFLQPLEFGIFALGWATGWVISLASDLGVQLFVSREIARDPAASRWLVPPLLRLRLSVAGVLFGAIGVVWWLFWWDIGGAAFLGLVLIQLLSSVTEFFNHIFRGFSRSDLESWANIFHRLGALVTGGCVLMLYPGLPWLVLVLLVVASLAVWLTGSWARGLVRESGHPATGPEDGPAVAPGPMRLRFFREVLPLGLGILASGIYFRLDLLFLEWYWGTTEVGLYTAVFRLVDGVRMFPAAVIVVLFPSLCRNQTRSLAAGLVGSLGLIALAATALLRYRPLEVVDLFYGEAYGAAGSTLAILALALAPLFVNLVLTHQLIAWRRQMAYMWSCLGVLFLTVPLNLLLIPSGGLEGTAWAVLARESILTVICSSLIWWSKPGVSSRLEGEMNSRNQD